MEDGFGLLSSSSTFKGKISRKTALLQERTNVARSHIGTASFSMTGYAARILPIVLPLLFGGSLAVAVELPLSQPSPWGTYLPKWAPTWDMRNSTILYACNYSGYHDVDEALQYGVVVYDWSNGRGMLECYMYTSPRSHPRCTAGILPTHLQSPIHAAGMYAPRLFTYTLNVTLSHLLNAFRSNLGCFSRILNIYTTLCSDYHPPFPLELQRSGPTPSQ